MDKIRSIFKNSFVILQLAWEEDKVSLIWYFLFTILSASLSIGVFFIYKFLIDSISQGNQLNPFSTLFLLVLTYLITQYLSQFLYTIFVQNYFDYMLFIRLQYYSGRVFMKKLAQLDFSQMESGEMRNLIAKVYQTHSWRVPAIIRKLGYMSYNIFSLTLTLFLAIQFNSFYFLLIALITLPFYYLRAMLSAQSFAIYSDRAENINLMWYLQQAFTEFSVLQEIKLYKLSNYFLKEMKKVQTEIFELYKKPMVKLLAIGSIEYLLIPFVLFFAYQSTINKVHAHLLTIGDFTLFIGLLGTFIADLSNILGNITSLYEDNLYVNDYVTFLNTKPALTHNGNAHIITAFKELTLSHVSFAYPDNQKEVLSDISFTIRKGDDIAIIGHNGAGKSTLIKLLLRFYDPTKGEILVDGMNLKDINIDSWYQCIGVLFQDFAKYSLSLEENVFFGDIGKKQKDVENTLAATQAEDVIASLTKGTKQRLGRWFDDGEELSVGQWQKVAIARALYRDAPLLILDEPTSNIDAEAEYKIFENLKKVYKEKSLIFISHRFSTVRMADKIFVLDKGKLMEQGTHKTLLRQKGLYAKYFTLQKKGYE